jgi:Translation-initiation factor 2
LVQASTLGALEALLQFLREDTKPPIPVSAIGIGTIHKRDVTKISIMNEKGHPEYATILAFDVDIEREAREHAVVSHPRKDLFLSIMPLFSLICLMYCLVVVGNECEDHDSGYYLPSF